MNWSYEHQVKVSEELDVLLEKLRKAMDEARGTKKNTALNYGIKKRRQLTFF